MFTVDIDTGGTMTDALVSDESRRHSFKVDTTPHDYTVSFVACLSEAAKKFDFPDVAAFLKQVNLIRWSSTITTNVLAERRGSKVGLLVSKGHEENLYGSSRSPVIGELVPQESVIGLSDDPGAKEVLGAVKELLESGVRRICVSLKNSFPNNQAELAVKAIIEDQYPDHIIGAVPVLLGSEMAQNGDDQTRAHYSLMNAYTHNQLASSLFKAEDLLRDRYNWSGALLIGHTSGGVSRIGKTKAVDTIESGPVFGTFGGAYVARQYGLDNVLCFDVGGTTTKASVVKGGEPVFQRGGKLMEIPVKTSFAMLRSAAVGGGSIARFKNGRVTLGPESMGAAPGPACYGLGGNEATLTDAVLCLSYLDAGSFLGGRRRLDVERARAAIDKNVARPMDVSIETAALAIRDEAVAIMAELISSTLTEAGLRPHETALFTFGGNGPMFGAFAADKLEMPSVYAFDLGPVFSAFGSSISDVVHVYERGVGSTFETAAKGNLLTLAADMFRQAARDLAGEGFTPSKAAYTFELEFGEGDQITGKARVDCAALPDQAWLASLARAVGEAGMAKSAHPVLLARLSSRFAVSNQAQQKPERPAKAIAPISREVGLNGGGMQSTPVHSWESLPIGARVQGPAVINGATLTCPLPHAWTLDVDQHGNACITRS